MSATHTILISATYCTVLHFVLVMNDFCHDTFFKIPAGRKAKTARIILFAWIAISSHWTVIWWNSSLCYFSNNHFLIIWHRKQEVRVVSMDLVSLEKNVIIFQCTSSLRFSWLSCKKNINPKLKSHESFSVPSCIFSIDCIFIFCMCLSTFIRFYDVHL